MPQATTPTSISNAGSSAAAAPYVPTYRTLLDQVASSSRILTLILQPRALRIYSLLLLMIAPRLAALLPFSMHDDTLRQASDRFLSGGALGLAPIAESPKVRDLWPFT